MAKGKLEAATTPNENNFRVDRDLGVDRVVSRLSDEGVTMINRRAFLKLAGVVALMPWGCARWHAEPAGVLLNDVHSGLNPTSVRDVISTRVTSALAMTGAKAISRIAHIFRIRLPPGLHSLYTIWQRHVNSPCNSCGVIPPCPRITPHE